MARVARCEAWACRDPACSALAIHHPWLPLDRACAMTPCCCCRPLVESRLLFSHLFFFFFPSLRALRSPPRAQVSTPSTRGHVGVLSARPPARLPRSSARARRHAVPPPLLPPFPLARTRARPALVAAPRLRSSARECAHRPHATRCGAVWLFPLRGFFFFLSASSTHTHGVGVGCVHVRDRRTAPRRGRAAPAAGCTAQPTFHGSILERSAAALVAAAACRLPSEKPPPPPPPCGCGRVPIRGRRDGPFTAPAQAVDCCFCA